MLSLADEALFGISIGNAIKKNHPCYVAVARWGDKELTVASNGSFREDLPTGQGLLNPAEAAARISAYISKHAIQVWERDCSKEIRSLYANYIFKAS